MYCPGSGSSSSPPCFLPFANTSAGRRTNSSSPKIPQNMLPFTKADIWPNIGRIVMPGPSGTTRANAAFASSLGFGIFMPLGAAITTDSFPFDASPGDLIGLAEQRLDALERRLAGVQDRDPVALPVNGMGHQLVQRGELVLTLVRKERPESLFAHADVEPKHAGPVQLRQLVKITVVLGDDRREREPAWPFEVPVRVVDEERVAPGHLWGAVCLRSHLDVGPRERAYVVSDRVLAHAGHDG